MKKLIILLLSLLWTASAIAQPFKQIIFFGDSLSDNGNLYHLIKVFPKFPPYFNGRFSNGTTWAEDLGKYYYDKYQVSYVNYAIGGASAVLHGSEPGKTLDLPITLESEIYSYYLQTLFANRSQNLYVIWIGANDYLYDKTSNIDTMTTAVINKITANIQFLLSKGAQHFLILNLPDLGSAPYADMVQAKDRLHQITVMHNAKLATAISNLQAQYTAAQFVPIYVYDLFNDLLANPEKYNHLYGYSISDTKTACLTNLSSLNPAALDNTKLNADLQAAFSGIKAIDIPAIRSILINTPALRQNYQMTQSNYSLCNNPDSHVFWDPLHPTEVVHSLLSHIVIETLEHSGQ